MLFLHVYNSFRHPQNQKSQTVKRSLILNTEIVYLYKIVSKNEH